MRKPRHCIRGSDFVDDMIREVGVNRDEYLKRAAEGKPIESFRELVIALQELQRERIPEPSEHWYYMNRLLRLCMTEADDEERGL
jgi:hypothetical protein